MKKLINGIDDVVKEQLQGLSVAHPDVLKVNFEPYYVTRADAPVVGKVALVSGGGSRHESLHGGFVGMGMLDGACLGVLSEVVIGGRADCRQISNRELIPYESNEGSNRAVAGKDGRCSQGKQGIPH